MQLCRAGNDLGYSGLYRKYARGIYNSIHRIVSHTGEAEDILQEAFVIAFREAASSEKVLNFEAWTRRIAINKSISHLRKRKIVFTDIDTLPVEADRGYDNEENELFESRLEDVRNSIEQLPTGYKTIVSLYLFEGIPQEEIARMLDISHSTVRTQYFRAKKKIISSLKDKTYG